MPCKAKATYAEAQSLFLANQFCGAANRTYYALYQVAVARVEKDGRKPTDLCQPDPSNPERWPHSCLVKNASLTGVGGMLAKAYGTRVKADYRTEPVRRDEVAGILFRVHAVLERAAAYGIVFQETEKTDGTERDSSGLQRSAEA